MKKNHLFFKNQILVFVERNVRLRSNIAPPPPPYTLLAFILFLFLQCADYSVSLESKDARTGTKATTEQDKTLLGNAVLRVSYEVETTSWGEVINKDNPRPGSDQIIKNIGLTMVDRTSNVFKLFEDGSYELTTIRQKPHSDIPNVIYSTPKDPRYENAYKTVMTDKSFTSFDQAGNIRFTLPYQGTKMLALVRAMDKECNENKAFLNNFPLLTLNGDATAILSSCARAAVVKEGGAVVSTKDGLILIKRKMANMNLGAYSSASAFMQDNGSSQASNTAKNPQQQQDIPPVPQLKGDVPTEQERDQIMSHDMAVMGNIQSQYDASKMESMTIVDSAENKVLGVAIFNHTDEKNASLMATSRYKYNDTKDKQIRIAHHEMYQKDLASGVEVQRTMQQAYDNVKVLTKE